MLVCTYVTTYLLTWPWLKRGMPISAHESVCRKTTEALATSYPYKAKFPSPHLAELRPALDLFRKHFRVRNSESQIVDEFGQRS